MQLFSAVIKTSKKILNVNICYLLRQSCGDYQIPEPSELDIKHLEQTSYISNIKIYTKINQGRIYTAVEPSMFS